MNPINVRDELLKTPVYGKNKSKCRVNFHLQPQVYVNHLWQGGETIQVKRVDDNEFKIGALPLMTLEEATRYIEEYLEQYRMPYVKSHGEEPRHPFMFHI